MVVGVVRLGISFDTSKQEVQIHLTEVIHTMREEWGVELFKLDANYWGYA